MTQLVSISLLCNCTSIYVLVLVIVFALMYIPVLVLVIVFVLLCVLREAQPIHLAPISYIFMASMVKDNKDNKPLVGTFSQTRAQSCHL